MEEIAKDAKQDLRDPEDVNIIYEVLRVRKIEEQFERGEIGMPGVLLGYFTDNSHFLGANTVIYLEGFRAEGNKGHGSANVASAVIEARDKVEQDFPPASDYATPESSSTLLKFEDVDTFTFQAQDSYGTGTDTSFYDSSLTALSAMGFHNPINQELYPVFIERNGLPGYYNQDLLS